MGRGIPDRWLNYKAVGEAICGTRFIAFKVPLKEVLVKDLEPEEKFTLDALVSKVKNIGLVIDLTNTNRYYSPSALDQWDIEHHKILCEGHKIPNARVINSFFGKVDDFLQQNPGNEKLIGVHCTHGLNRTGYLICRYMIDRMGVEPVVAIERFNNARGHDMERINYLQSLQSGEDDNAQSNDSISTQEYSKHDVKEAGSLKRKINEQSNDFNLKTRKPNYKTIPARSYNTMRTGQGHGIIPPRTNSYFENQTWRGGPESSNWRLQPPPVGQFHPRSEPRRNEDRRYDSAPRQWRNPNYNPGEGVRSFRTSAPYPEPHQRYGRWHSQGPSSSNDDASRYSAWNGAYSGSSYDNYYSAQSSNYGAIRRSRMQRHSQ